MKIGIIGLGLIGGSFALAMKKRTNDFSFLGWDQSAEHLQKALDLGIIDEAAPSMEALLAHCDWIVLAIPVNVIEQLVPEILGKLKPNQFLVDFGSTKEAICAAVDSHPNRNQYLAAHPIAGTEYSGPEAAFANLFEDKVMIVCDEEATDERAIGTFRKWCKMIGMSTTYLSSADHDKHLAYVSHLSHVIAFGLSNTVLKEEEHDERLLDLAGSGFASTVRLAKSSPDMWTPIFMKNRTAILEGVNNYLNEVEHFKKLLEEGDEAGIKSFLEKGRAIRKILK